MADQDVLVIDKPRSPQVTPETIQETMQSIALLQDMVRHTLIRDVDYGRIPGTPQDSLWDPGASMIIGSFNCYCGQRRILKLEDGDSKIAVCIEVPILSRRAQQEVGSGIGAASTLETKYKYRWVAKPQDWGYDDAAIKTFKTKRGREDGRETMLYRIPNPEHSELLNTIIKMASKRAEVDAAESLPGVSSVLRQIFSGKAPRQDRAMPQDDYTSPRWQRFWGEVTRLGFTQQEAHQKLGVASMHDWLADNHTLPDAIAILRQNNTPSVEELEQLAKEQRPTLEDLRRVKERVDSTIAQRETKATEAYPQPMDEDYEPLFDDMVVEASIDPGWLSESLKTLRPSGWDVADHIRKAYPNAKGKTIGDAVASLTAEQRAQFAAEIQKRLEVKGK